MLAYVAQYHWEKIIKNKYQFGSFLSALDWNSKHGWYE